MNDGINKIGEIDGIPVYKDDYMSEGEFRYARGPMYPDAWYIGPAIYENGKLVKPDGTPLYNGTEDHSYATKFILTGCNIDTLERRREEIRKTLKEKYGE